MSSPNPEPLLDFLERDVGPSEPDAAVIWLHGLGADGHDFEPIVPALGLPPDLSVRFIFPHAPAIPVSINMGMVMPAWYDITGLDPESRADGAGVKRSVAAVTRLIERVRSQGVASERIVIAGFSQGGAVAWHLGLRHPERLAGLLLLSTYLPMASTVEAEASAANAQSPIFQCHGTQDPVVPMQWGQMGAELMRSQGRPIEFNTYPCPHSVHPREIADIGQWLARVLSA